MRKTKRDCYLLCPIFFAVQARAFLWISPVVIRPDSLRPPGMTFPRIPRLKYQSISVKEQKNAGEDTFRSPSELSTRELLAELDRNNIRYRPAATRKELEQLLLQTTNNRNGNFAKTDVALIVQELVAKGVRLPQHASRSELERLLQEHRQKPHKGEGKIKTNPTKPRRNHRALSRILRELDELGISYPPGASPAALERILREYNNEASKTTISDRPKRQHTTYKSTKEILEELNRRGVRFSPTATREELEELLRNQRKASRGGTTVPDQSEDRFSEQQNIQIDPLNNLEPPTSKKKVDSAKYPTTTYYGESLHNAKKGQDAQDPLHRQEPRQKHKMKTQKSILSKLYVKSTDYAAKAKDSATTRLSRAAEQAARKARYATRSAKDFFAEDEDGIRDADFYYVKKDIAIDVSAEPVEERSSHEAKTSSFKPQRPYPGRPSSQEWNNGDFGAARYSYERYGNVQRTKRPRRGQQPSSFVTPEEPPRPASTQGRQNARDPTINSASQSNLFRLPPAKSSDHNASKTSSSSKSQRRRESKSDKGRTVYSPYDENDLPSQVYRDTIDKIGEFMGNAAETILWGRIDDEKDRSNAPSNPGVENSASKKTRETSRNKNKRDPVDGGGSTTWKDRLEERFDSMLGIHEDGEYYNRWARQEEGDKSSEGGNDAFSVAQGRAPKRARRAGRRKVYDRPFWEQENVISSLFGKSPPSGYNNVGPGNLLPFIKTMVKSFVLLATNACEWATVRGSLPQPVVVVGVTSCVLSARPGSRLLTAALALVGFRIFGEFIHEGLHGDEDWEEHSDDEDDREIEHEINGG